MFGFNLIKGYYNKQSGQTFYELKFNPQEVLDYGKTEKTPTQETKRVDTSKPLWDVRGTGDKVSQQTVQKRQDKIPSSQEKTYDTTNHGRDDPKYVKDGTNDKKPYNELAPDGKVDSITDEISVISNKSANTITKDVTDESSKNGNDTTTEINTTRTTEPDYYPNDPTGILKKLRSLPRDVFNFMTDYRLLYKTIDEYRYYVSFKEEMESNGFYYEEKEMQQLYDLLVEYATNYLRELRKGTY